jgi:hypothetical protein
MTASPSLTPECRAVWPFAVPGRPAPDSAPAGLGTPVPVSFIRITNGRSGV